MNESVEKASKQLPVSLKVEGMHCASCVSRIERLVQSLTGNQFASVNLATGIVRFFTHEGTNIEKIVAGIENLGYSVGKDSEVLNIPEMHCASCTQKIEESIRSLPGILSIGINPVNKTARIEYLKGAFQFDQLSRTIGKAGYSVVRIIETNQNLSNSNEELLNLKKRLILAVIFALPVVAIEMVQHVFPPITPVLNQLIGESSIKYFQFIMTSILLCWPGFIFIKRGVMSLWHFSPDMNALVAIGTVSAWLYSVISTFTPSMLPKGADHIYYESAVTIVALILLGRFLEERAKGRANDSIRHLMNLTPKFAMVVRGELETETPVTEVVRGDRVRIKPGKTVPVDGLVVEGTTYIDESLISGEPIPVEKCMGSKVVGGSINQSGSILIEATNVGIESTISRIVRLIEEAQASKLPIQSLVDKITGWFVPVMILLAILTFLVWSIFGPAPSVNFALVNAVAVLIVACPCAMGLATPISIVVSTGRAASAGMLFRKGNGLERLRDIDVVVVDKTGTLTEGRPTLEAIVPSTTYSEIDLLTFASALESRSEHPIAKAIVDESSAKGIKVGNVDKFEMTVGRGVSGIVEGKAVRIGTEQFVCENLTVDRALQQEFQSRTKNGQMVQYISIDGQVGGIFVISDQLKESSIETIKAIHDFGLATMMLTGDNAQTAKSVAQSLGISEFHAGLLPEQKIKKIRDLKKLGYKIAFVGDGINDAPALSESDVGIAIGTGTDIAVESADLVLMANDMRNVANAVVLSRVTMRNIATNLFWAFAYNICLIPIAAGILYPEFQILMSPMFAAFAMAMSSLFVVGNALRLKRSKLPYSVVLSPANKNLH